MAQPNSPFLQYNNLYDANAMSQNAAQQAITPSSWGGNMFGSSNTQGILDTDFSAQGINTQYGIPDFNGNTPGGFLGNLNMQDVASGVSSIGGLFNIYAGLRGLNTAKDDLAFRRNAWNQEFGVKKEIYNREKDRQDGLIANENRGLAARANSGYTAGG